MQNYEDRKDLNLFHKTEKNLNKLKKITASRNHFGSHTESSALPYQWTWEWQLNFTFLPLLLRILPFIHIPMLNALSGYFYRKIHTKLGPCLHDWSKGKDTCLTYSPGAGIKPLLHLAPRCNTCFRIDLLFTMLCTHISHKFDTTSWKSCHRILAHSA